MGDVVTILAALFLIGLLSYLARLLRRRLRAGSAGRSTAERAALAEAEVLTRSRLPF